MKNYSYLRAYNILTGFPEDSLIDKAIKENAPADSVYRTVYGKWYRFIDIESEFVKGQIRDIIEDFI